MEEFLLVFHVLSNGTPEENLQVCEYATYQTRGKPTVLCICMCLCVCLCLCMYSQKIFRIFDVNNDGTISETEMEKLVEDMKVLLGVG